MLSHMCGSGGGEGPTPSTEEGMNTSLHTTTTTMATQTDTHSQNHSEMNELPPPRMISQRAHQTLAFPTFSSNYTKMIQANLYDKLTNPKGIINLAQAVNRLMEEEVLARLNMADALTLTAKHQYYSDTNGIPELRTAIAKLLTRHHKPQNSINPDNLIVMNGITACLDALSHTLCDPDDVVITPTPVYGRIYTNFHDRSAATVIPLVCSQEDDFALNVKDLEKLIEKTESEGRCVRACVLLHPHNPLGHIYSTAQLRSIMEICAQHEVHVIIDEIYAFSIYNKEIKFNSVLGFESLPDPQRTHVLWGFSKDFSIPGFRLGVIHSLNPWVLSCVTTLSHYHSCPQVIQHAAATIINDEEWCDGFYLPTNQERLAKAHHKICQRLQEMEIAVCKGQGGLYVWANLQAYLQPCTEEREMALFMALVDGGVCILPGKKLYCVNPGWFRIIFAVPDEELEEGLSRIEVVLYVWKKNIESDSS
ncbi:probable inactive 1-aminocyclopropane-1-carboxylate synthase-like protein 2 [Homarus americanus]|uniref:probable inactive 1-aminocyclopropane-1-carboxylate synthase-like protein 2 n=1 Tax=Homarus americanus TaxID=6706 RepID=UPI001C461176|nr:probable inactive 1-aminocyclopropane-1-carboxylate synthase-like protein 2 [Homarus americanus]